MRNYDPPAYLNKKILEFVWHGRTVLDLGAGMAGYHQELAKVTERLLLIDAYQPYLEARKITSASVSTLCGVAPRCLYGLPALMFDMVLGIDFVEHMIVDDALQTISHMKRLAREAVLLFVPEGNHPQTTDAFAMGGDHWQTHRSTWTSDMLEGVGFCVERWPDFHEGGSNDPGALWCVWRRHNA